jgi:hypothetical protein
MLEIKNKPALANLVNSIDWKNLGYSQQEKETICFLEASDLAYMLIKKDEKSVTWRHLKAKAKLFRNMAAVRYPFNKAV